MSHTSNYGGSPLTTNIDKQCMSIPKRTTIVFSFSISTIVINTEYAQDM